MHYYPSNRQGRREAIGKMVDREAILSRFVTRFDGREDEVGYQAIAYGEINMIAKELGIDAKDVASVLLSEIDSLV